MILIMDSIKKCTLNKTYVKNTIESFCGNNYNNHFNKLIWDC